MSKGRKLTHPIRRMQEATYKSTVSFSRRQTEKVMVRHVKPLLDALEHAQEWLAEQGCDCGTDEPGTCALCEVERVLAAWRAPLG